MVTEIYKIAYIDTINGNSIQASPLKIKYLKSFMDAFALLKTTTTDDGAINIISECARIAMKQYCPEISTVENVEDNFDLSTIYDILEFGAGIKLNKVESEDEIVPEQENKPKGQTWEDLDLAKLESEVFLLGNWKNYDELESSISIQELMSILTSIRELDYQEKRFLAAIQGIDIDAKPGDKPKGQKEWEDMKARVFSGGKATDSRDILALQGQNAKKYGFGIGMGLDYEDDTK